MCFLATRRPDSRQRASVRDRNDAAAPLRLCAAVDDPGVPAARARLGRARDLPCLQAARGGRPAGGRPGRRERRERRPGPLQPQAEPRGARLAGGARRRPERAVRRRVASAGESPTVCLCDCVII